MLANSKGDENRVFNCEYNPYDGRLVTGGDYHLSTSLQNSEPYLSLKPFHVFDEKCLR